jgi:hypothetical protein
LWNSAFDQCRQQGVCAVRRYHLFVVALPLLVALSGCETLGLKANIVSFTSMNGKTEVKQREAKNWDEFKSAMSEVGTDFSEVSKEVGSTTAKLAKALVEAPPPGKVKLGQLDPSLAKYEGNDKLDFIAAASKKPDAPYDFTYVQIGVPSYDEFFKAAAEVYAVAFQMKETVRRIKVASGALTGEKPADSDKASSAADKARKVEATDDNKEMATYFEALDGVYKLVAVQGASFASKCVDLVSKGQALIMSAPSSITNPKTVLHIKLILKGLEQSVSLIKDSAKIMADLVG